jgi:5-methylcytosine-specific restriction enzyme subunit McrC
MDSGSIPTHVRQHASQAWTSSPLLDIFIDAFLESAGRVVGQGLLHRYKAVNEDLPALRGRISWPRQASVLLGRCDRIACAYDEFTADVPHNQVLKCALKAVNLSRSGHLSRRSGALLSHFEDVSDVAPASIRGTASTRDRQSRRYETCLEWAWIVLDALSPSLRHGLHSAPSLLFDMNKVFEAIAARCVSAEARANGTYVSLQDTSHHLGTYGIHPVTQLRPDLVLRDEGRQIAVADAKWKRLERDSRGVPNIDGHDVYQLLAYAAAFDLREVTLIYPMHEGIRAWQPGPIELRSHDGGAVTLSILLIDLGCDGYDVATSAGWHTSSQSKSIS